MARLGQATATLGLGWALWMAACGSDEGGASSGVLGLNGGTQEDIQAAYCERYATELCAARRKCCADLPPDDALFSCEDSIDLDCNLSTSTEMRDGRTFAGDRIDATIKRLQDAAANCGTYQLPDDGDPFAVRELPLGESCQASSPSDRCAGELNCVASKCSELGNVGDPCGYNTVDCAGGLYCSRQTCQPVGKLSEECEGNGSCAAGLECAPTDTDAMTNLYQCFEPRAVGEPCGLDRHCASLSCEGLLCAPCTGDSACGSGARCMGGECLAGFGVCEADPSYFR